MVKTPGTIRAIALFFHIAPALIISLSQINCTGYTWGTAKPEHLSEVKTLCVAMVENKTQVPRAASLTTNSLVDAITRDGTYRVSSIDQADAHLLTTLKKIQYRQARSTREDTLRSEELEMEAHPTALQIDVYLNTHEKMLRCRSTSKNQRLHLTPCKN